MIQQLAPTDTAVTCPVCQTARVRQVYQVETVASYGIARCGQCGFVFASPRPTPEELDAFYGSEYFQKQQPQGTSGYSDYRNVGELNARRQWKPFLEYAGLGERGGRRILDVGCGTGGFLAEAKADGWSAVGVELAQFAVDIANDELQLEVYRSDIFTPRLRPASFDVITMWHVLEHLIDPLDSLTRARELLVEGGLLFVELPNWNSIGRSLRGTEWAQLKPPEHINYFNRRSLPFAAQRAGFEVLKSTTHYPSLMDRAAIRRASRPLHQAVAVAAKVACAVGRGGYLRVLARK